MAHPSAYRHPYPFHPSSHPTPGPAPAPWVQAHLSALVAPAYWPVSSRRWPEPPATAPTVGHCQKKRRARAFPPNQRSPSRRPATGPSARDQLLLERPLAPGRQLGPHRSRRTSPGCSEDCSGRLRRPPKRLHRLHRSRYPETSKPPAIAVTAWPPEVSPLALAPWEVYLELEPVGNRVLPPAANRAPAQGLRSQPQALQACNRGLPPTANLSAD